MGEQSGNQNGGETIWEPKRWGNKLGTKTVRKQSENQNDGETIWEPNGGETIWEPKR